MKTRLFYFQVDENFLQIDFGNWLLVLYYAKSISLLQFKVLYKLSFSAYSFYKIFLDSCKDRHEQWGQFKNSFYDSNHEPVSELCLMDRAHLDRDSYEILFDRHELESACLFVHQLIARLEAEPLDLLELYGGELSFIKLLYADNDFIDIGLYEGQERYWHNARNIDILRDLNKNIFDYCLRKEKAYEVYIE